MKTVLLVLIAIVFGSCGYPFEPYIDPRDENNIEVVTDTTTNEVTITIEV